MKVAMLVGMLMFKVITGLYESGWLNENAPSEAGQVHVCDWPPPPPSYP
jgi:hypothetical protein